MKILVSNDDGINALGIKILVQTLSQDHDVYIVAPDSERSAASQSITLHSPIRVKEVEPRYGAKRSWTTSGTPSDCVKMALSTILSDDEKPDMVISGINHGPNLGYDILYSGTVSAAIEGALANIPSVAVSLFAIRGFNEDSFRPTANFVRKFLPSLKDFQFPYKSVININFPNVQENEIKGIKITEMGENMFSDNYEKRVDPRGRDYYWMAGKLTHFVQGENTDISAVKDNYVSISPITFELTRKEELNRLNELVSNILV